MGKSKEKAPEQRNYQNEMEQTIAAQIKMQPQILAAQQQYAPQYTDLNTSLLKQALQGSIQTAQDTQGAYANAEQQAIMSNPILARLQGMAVEDLAMGGDLSAQEQLAADQAVKQRFANRGTLGSNQSLLQQILNRGDYSNARRQQRMSNAQSIYGTTQQGTGLLQSLVGSSAGSVGQPSINPESAYAADVYNTNYNAQQAKYINSKNNQAGLLGGIIGGTTGMFKFGK